MSPKDATKLRRREVPAAPLAGASGGEMGRLIQTKDWSGTPLGPLETWPQSQKTAVNLVLNSQHPMWLGWGPECTFLYNDAYLQVLGAAKHPWALGRPAAEVWAEIWDVCGPLARKVFQAGEASFVDHVRLFLKRDGYLEETFYSFSYSPIYDESGQVAGLFCPSNEITDRLLTERRLKTLSELAARAYLEKTTDAACHSAITTIAKNPADIPFALLYLTDPAHPSVTLKGAVGVPRGDPEISPEIVDVSHPGSCAWPLDPVLGTATGRVVPVDSYSILPIGLAQQRLKEALVIPVSAAGQEHPVSLLVVGVSPGRPLDREYRTFFELVAGQVGTAILSARAAEEEKRRAEELAKLDKEKTAFFSNVSHEFRTPLTLLLGPMEEALRSPGHSLSGEQLEAAHRNAVRLLKLVNTLLDFSRIEAGRLDARFERVDLGRVTRELTGIFRSAVERAGLRFTVDIPDLDSDVYVDPTMWEKIVLNLLSNALKFTFEGEIAVRLRAEGSKVVLEIADTGIGIPGTELSRIFERKLGAGNSNSRVGDLEHDLGSLCAQADGDLAFKGELQGIGEQIEDDLLPHRRIDIDVGVEIRNVDRKAQSCPLDGGAEDARQFASHPAQVDPLEAGVESPGLDAGEIEQRIDKLEESDGIAMRGFQLLAGERVARGAEGLLHRAQEQGQRGAEFVAHVGKEGRLLLVELRQLLRAALLLLGSPRAEDRGADLTGHQLEERPIFAVQRPAGTDPDHQEADRMLLSGGGDRDYQGFLEPLLRQADRQNGIAVDRDHAAGGGPQDGIQRPGAGPGVRDVDDLGTDLRVAPGDPDGTLQGHARMRGIGQIKQRERNVRRILRDRGYGGMAGRVGRFLKIRTGGKLGEGLQAALGQQAVGDLVAGAEQAGHLARFVIDGTVGEGIEGFLQVAVALQEEADVVDEGRFARLEHLPRQRSADVPDFRPDFCGRPSQGPGVLCRAQHLKIRVIIKERAFRSPAQPHGMLGIQDQVDGCLLTLGPGLQGSQWGPAPVLRLNEPAHLPAGGAGKGCRGDLPSPKLGRIFGGH